MQRRDLIAAGGTFALAALVATEAHATPTSSSAASHVVDVVRFGAIGDGRTLDTKAFKDAGSELKSNGGGTLYIPPTKRSYLLDEDIQLWNNVNVVYDGFVKRANNDKRTFDAVFIPVPGAQHVTFTNAKIDCGNVPGINGIIIRRNNRFCRIAGAYIRNSVHDPGKTGGGRAIVLEDGVTDGLPKQTIATDIFLSLIHI